MCVGGGGGGMEVCVFVCVCVHVCKRGVKWMYWKHIRSLVELSAVGEAPQVKSHQAAPRGISRETCD